MANPNRTVAAWRNRKWVCTKHADAKTQWEAEAVAVEWKKAGCVRVRVTSYKYGSRQDPRRGWQVRSYEQA